ncbi:MAG: hypothetical protein E6R03_08785 [Hyphomicrobiaceae bacterium]|jgi:hypothetical protein|nr:MAG: hypothetical protein E6R03_08785 [Hyphomicrobiaceae bacterium]
MNVNQQLSPGALLIAEVTSGGVFASLLHSMAAIPPWLGGAMSALVVGALLRVLDSPLREMSEGIAARLRRYWKKE